MIAIKNMDKAFFKEDKSTKRSINRGIQKLEARLSEYLTKDIKIENIFNDDVLIHDIINKRFYVYKCQVDRIQLRILYTVIDESMIIISHYCKKAPTKEYINYFEKVSSAFIFESEW